MNRQFMHKTDECHLGTMAMHQIQFFVLKWFARPSTLSIEESNILGILFTRPGRLIFK